MIEVLAHAKLTLSLRVTGRRDDGYHEIEATMTTVDLADRLEIGPLDWTFSDDDSPARGRARPAGMAQVVMLDESGDDFPGAPAVSDNLITRALRLCGRDARVTVYKRIPAGAGLGGGSADAAAVLRWAGFEDRRAAAAIGADVAFCLTGGRAEVSGKGEIVKRVAQLDEQYTLLTPPVRCATAAVYAAWDEMGSPVGANGNDLEPAALRVAPALARHRDLLGDATGLTPRLAGSGSTWFVKGSHPGPGRVVTSTTFPA